MKITTADYASFEAVVDGLASPTDVFYTVGNPDTAAVTGIWAVWLTDDVVVEVGGRGTELIDTTTFLADFASAILVSAELNVTV